MKKICLTLCMLLTLVLWTGCQRQETAEENHSKA